MEAGIKKTFARKQQPEDATPTKEMKFDKDKYWTGENFRKDNLEGEEVIQLEGKEAGMVDELKSLKGNSVELDIIIENILFNRLCTVPRQIKEVTKVCN